MKNYEYFQSEVRLPDGHFARTPCGSIETTTTEKTHSTLPACFVNIIFSVIKHIAQKLVDPCFYFFVTVFDLKDR